MTDIILAGVGGQGTILASKLLARAAMDMGIYVRTAETIGMAQRGGSVVSHVRIGDCDSSMIPTGQADAIIAFEPGEAVRCLPYLKKDGLVVTATAGVMPVTASLGGYDYVPQAMLDYLSKKVKHLKMVDADEVARQCGSYKVVNVALLGAAASYGLGDITRQSIEQAARAIIPARFIEMNIQALNCVE